MSIDNPLLQQACDTIPQSQIADQNEGRKIHNPYDATTQERYTTDEMRFLETVLHKETNQ